MRTPFSYAVYPPAPALEIRLVNPISGRRSDNFLAVLDTGADLTVAPLHMLQTLRIPALRRERVRGLWGGQAIVQVFLLDILVNDELYSGVEILGGASEDEILIGRSLSNLLRLLLDGPDSSVEVLNGY